MKTKKESKLLSVMTAVLTALAVVAGSIAVPILCRPFYYAHVTPMQMRLRVRLTEEQVRETYDEVMDYCLGFTENFQLSHLTWSADGAAHFADVQRLFLLDFEIAAAAIIGLVLLRVVARYRNIKPARLKGHNSCFWVATGLVSIFALLGLVAAIDFDHFFSVFHAVFFPGKDNWIFNPDTDPVINMLPQVFFRNCGILVAALIFISCILFILIDITLDKKRNETT